MLTQPALSVTVTVYKPAGKFETVFDATFMVEPTMVPEAFVQTKSQGLAPEVGVAVIEPVLAPLHKTFVVVKVGGKQQLRMAEKL